MTSRLVQVTKHATGALLAASAMAAWAAPTDPVDELRPRIDRAIDSAIAEQRIVGAVVLMMRDGKLIYRRAAGMADRDRNKPMREDAVFRLASVTKPIVSAAALRLVEQGVLQLDAPVTRYLPDFQPALPDGSRPPITIAQLLSHTAGLSYSFYEPEDSPYRKLGVSDGLDQPGLSLEENLRRLGAAPLAYRPGSNWRYSLAIDVLGAVMEQAAGKPLARIVRQSVTGPLRMTDTDFTVTDRARLVTPYVNAPGAPRPMAAQDKVEFKGSVIRFAPGRHNDTRSYASGGAGMAGTAADVLRLLQDIAAGDTVLHRPSAALMMHPHVGAWAQTQGPGWGFGYGGAVLVDPKAAGTSMPAGTFQWGGVYGHNWWIDPVHRITVVALTNTSTEGMAGKFPNDLREAVYGAGPAR